MRGRATSMGSALRRQSGQVSGWPRAARHGGRGVALLDDQAMLAAEIACDGGLLIAADTRPTRATLTSFGKMLSKMAGARRCGPR
jgi:hypothetical protein